MRIEVPVLPCKVRSDNRGNGNFGASRGVNPDGSRDFHDGVDLEVEPGQAVVAPFNAYVEKIEYPYASDLSWKGVQISNDRVRCEIWYMEPRLSIIKTHVGIGHILGYAQDISLKYPPNEHGAMTPHIHVRVSLKPFTYLIDGRYQQKSVFVDPLIFFNLSQV